MEKNMNVINFYVLANRLKNNIRQGWLDWSIDCDRVESVAEHVFGSIMVAIGMKSEYSEEYKDVNLERVALMISVHELDKAFMQDYSLKQITKEERRNALVKALDGLAMKDDLLNLIDEFNARETEDAKFAYTCNEFESDLQSKIYDKKGYVDVNNGFVDPYFKDYYGKGMSWSEMWMRANRERCNYDDNFMSVSDEAIKASIPVSDKEN